jgi:hypothetical protein
MSVAFSAFVWSGHSCPLPLGLILVLVLILICGCSRLASDSSQSATTNQKTTLTSKAADKSVRPTRSFSVSHPKATDSPRDEPPARPAPDFAGYTRVSRQNFRPTATHDPTTHPAKLAAPELPSNLFTLRAETPLISFKITGKE